MRCKWVSYRWVGLLMCVVGLLPVRLSAIDLPDSLCLDTPERQISYLFLRGIEKRTAGDRAGAEALFDQAVAIDSLSSAPLFELAKFQLERNQIGVGQRMIERALLRDSLNTYYLQLNANIYRSQGNLSKATAIYERLVELKPRNPELLYQLADLYIKGGKVLQAIEAFDNVELEMGLIEEVSLYKMQLYIAIKENEKAYREIRRLIAKYPQEPNYVIILGDVFLETEQPDSALVQYNKALAMSPDNPNVASSMISYYEAIGDSEAALAYLGKALRNDQLPQEELLTYLSRYIAAQKKNKVTDEEIDALLSSLVKQHDQLPDLHAIYAQYLVERQLPQEAVEQLKAAIKIDATNLKYWLQWIEVINQGNDIVAAESVVRQALEANPESYEMYYYLGSFQMQQQKMEDALKTYQKGLSFVPEEKALVTSNYYGQIGDIYQFLEEQEKAFASYDLSLVAYPDNYSVMNNYAYYLSLTPGADMSKAERLSGRCVQLQPKNATFLDTYAWIYFKQEQYTLAKVYIESAISNGGSEQYEVIDHYGDILYFLGEKEKAVEQWKKAYELQGRTSKIIKRKIRIKRYVD